MEDNIELGKEIRQLEDVIYDLIEKDSTDTLSHILFLHMITQNNDYMLGNEVRKLYKEINYFFDEYKNDTHTNSN